MIFPLGCINQRVFNEQNFSNILMNFFRYILVELIANLHMRREGGPALYSVLSFDFFISSTKTFATRN